MNTTTENTTTETAAETAIPEAIPETAAETATASTAAPVDVTQARAKLAALRADCEAQELELAESEHAQAQAAHVALYEQCVAAQGAYDAIDGEVATATHRAHQASDRRNRANQMIPTHRMNNPASRAQFGVARKYGDNSDEVWGAQLEGYEAEQAAAELEYGEAFGVVMRLQGDRRLAATTLQDLSWAEGRARSRAEEARRTLDALKPPAEAPGWHEPRLNGTTITFTSDNTVRPSQSRIAATREPGDPI